MNRVSKSENIFENNLNTKITVLDTGLETMTGGRLKLGAEYLNEENFYLTYGDGIANINLEDLTNSINDFIPISDNPEISIFSGVLLTHSHSPKSRDISLSNASDNDLLEFLIKPCESDLYFAVNFTSLILGCFSFNQLDKQPTGKIVFCGLTTLLRKTTDALANELINIDESTSEVMCAWSLLFHETVI